MPCGDGYVNPQTILDERLADRAPIPDRLSHYTVVDHKEAGCEEAVCLASVLHRLAKVCLRLRSGSPKVTRGKRELCVEQLRWLFGLCRVAEPGRPADSSHTHSESAHVSVLAGGCMFELRVIEGEAAVGVGRLAAELRRVSQLAREHTQKNVGGGGDVSCFTRLPRDEWAVVRAELLQDARSRHAVRCAESALFVVGMDSVCSGAEGDADAEASRAQPFAVQAQAGTGCTRWYGHGLNVAVRGHQAALLLEESCCDAFALTWLTDALCAEDDGPTDAAPAEDAEEMPLMVHHAASCGCPAVLNSRARMARAEEAGSARGHVAALQARCAATFTTPTHAALLHCLKLSAESLVQLAGVLAYRTLTRCPPFPLGMHAADMRFFKAGRSINHVPVCSKEVRAFLEAATHSGPERLASEDEVARLLVHAMESADATYGDAGGCKRVFSPAEAGRTPHYTAERVYVPANRTYGVYGTPSEGTSLHFTYRLSDSVGGTNTFWVVSRHPDFAAFPQAFEAV